MDRIISVNTLAYQGYDLPTALQEISELGIGYVELAFLATYGEIFAEQDFSMTNASKLRGMLSDYGLHSVALSAHMDLGTPQSVPAFQQRMEFAREIGTRIIHTNASQLSRETTFFKNMELLARFAEPMGMIIALENPGDGQHNIITSGETGASVMRKIGSQFVKLNYDVCNAFSYSKATIKPEEDFKHALPFAAHLHLKDMKPREGGWAFSQIGEGVINYRPILEYLSRTGQDLPMSIELPLKLRRDEAFDLQEEPSTLDLPEIRRILEGSLEFIKEHIVLL